MENQKQTPIRTYSDAGAAKLREMSEDPGIYADFLKFQGRVFKHNANVALEFFTQKPDAQFIATKEQWERVNRSVAQGSKAIPFMNKKGGIVGFYDFSQIEGEDLPHRWTIHAKNAAEIKAALGIPANGNLVSGAVQNMLAPSETIASMAALRVPPQEFRKFSSSFISTVQCIISGRLEVGGSRFNVVPDAAMFSELQTESEKLGFLNLAANAARKILLNIERAALDLEAAERNERNERENQLQEIHAYVRGGMESNSGREAAGSSEGAADEQDHSVESGTQGRSDGLSVNTGSDERKQHEMDADIRPGDSERTGILVQTRPDQRTVSSESDGAGGTADGRANREVRDGLDGLHGRALSGGNSGNAVSASLSDGGTVGGEVGTGIPGDTGEGLREDEPTSDQRQLRGESGMASGDGFLRGQHGDEGESLNSGDESLKSKLNSVFSPENSETSTDSADVFVLDEETAELSDEEQLVQLTLEIKQGEELIADLVRERKYAEVSRIAQELEELNRRTAAPKEKIQKRSITEEDIQALHGIYPAKKSIQNFLEVEVAQTTKFEGKLNHTLGVKSPYKRAGTTFRENDERRIPIITVPSKGCSFSSVKKDIKNEIIAEGRSAEGGLSITNIDTGWIIQISRKGLEDSVAHARSRKNSATFNALYNLEDLMKNAVLLDATVSEHNNKNKSPDTLLMHKMYAPFKIDSEFFLAKITIEEFGSDKIAAKKRLYNLQDIKLKPLSDLSFTERNQLHLSVLNGSDISIAQLRKLVKTYDKNFYENPDAPGREAREAELYAHAEYLDAVETAATGTEVTAETDKQIERIAESRGIGTEEAKAFAEQIVDTNSSFSAGETPDSTEPDDISFSEKVHAAFSEVAERHKYTAKQQKFMERLERFVNKRHVTENMIDEMAKLPAFRAHYNNRNTLSRTIFAGRLGSLERELTEAIQTQLAAEKVDAESNSYGNTEPDAKIYISDNEQQHSHSGTHTINTDEQLSLFDADTSSSFTEEPDEKKPDVSNTSEIHTFSEAFGLDEAQLRTIVESGATEENLNEYGRFNKLLETVDKEKAGTIIDENGELPQFRRNPLIHKAIREFVLHGIMPEKLLAEQVPKVEMQENFTDLAYAVVRDDQTVRNAHENSDKQEYRTEVRAAVDRLVTDLMTGEQKMEDYTVSDIADFVNDFQSNETLRNQIYDSISELVDIALTSLEETRRNAQELGMPFSDKFSSGINDVIDPYVYDGSMSIDDFEKVQQSFEDDNILSENPTTEPDAKVIPEKTFAEQIDDILNGNANRYNDLKVCDTPDILLQVGCEQLPMLYTQRHLKEAIKPKNGRTHAHGLEIEQLKRIPELLEEPVMIMDSVSRNDSIVVVTSEVDKDNCPVIVSIHPNGSGSYEMEKVDSNFVTSIYGRENFGIFLERVVETDNLLYYDKQKSQELLRVLGLQSSQGVSNLDSDTIIHQSRNIVKRESGISSGTFEPDAKVDTISTFSEPETTVEEEIHDNTPELRGVLNTFSEKHGLGELNVAPAKYGNWSLSEKMQDGTEHPMGGLYNPEYGMPFTPETLQTSLEHFEKAAKDRGQDISDLYGRRAVANMHGGAASLPKVQEDLPEITYASNPSGKISDNIDAIHEMLRLEKAERTGQPLYDARTNQYNSKQASDARLRKYCGWGGLPQLFDERFEQHSYSRKRLKEMLTPDEYAAARESTLNAHYTPQIIIDAMYKAVQNMELPRDAKILEPACGTGNFISRLPHSLSDAQVTGVELDSITARIAKQLNRENPNVKIIESGFEHTHFENDSFDLAIGNVPFGNYKLNDPDYTQDWLIHDAFFRKSLDKVAPGGVVAFVTSSGTMDKASPKIREHLATQAELIGAIRLPETAFSDAGTKVTSDIIFLKKREHPLQAHEPKPDWCYTIPNADGLKINSYFVENPQMVLGRMEKTSHFDMLTCKPFEGTDLKTQLEEAIKGLNAKITVAKRERAVKERSGMIEPWGKNFTFQSQDGKVYYRQGENMQEVKRSSAEIKKLTLLCEIRDITRKLLDMQKTSVPDEKLLTVRAELNKLYDSYTEQYGAVSSKDVKKLFGNDADYPILQSLERKTPETDSYEKADIFFRRTVNPMAEITSVNTAEEALQVALDRRGKPDMIYMATLMQEQYSDVHEAADSICAELLDKGYIFIDPENQIPDKPFSGVVERSEYLSGNVRMKLTIAEEYAKANPMYNKNVETLKAVIPEDIKAEEIAVRMGCTWIEPEDYTEFLEHLSGRKVYNARRCDVSFSHITGEFSIISAGSKADLNLNETTTYGTADFSLYQLAEKILNQRRIVVQREVPHPKDPSKTVTRTDAKATKIALDKAKAIREEFQKWIFADEKRKSHYERKYNDIFNSLVGREYDGSKLTFPGITTLNDFALRPHQRNCVARAIYGGNTLAAHVVGAGKSAVMFSTVMKKKELGLIHKACVVVPKPLTEQTANEWRKIYPDAKILTVTNEDLSSEAKRKLFTARVATGSIMPLSCHRSSLRKFLCHGSIVWHLCRKNLTVWRICCVKRNWKVTASVIIPLKRSNVLKSSYKQDWIRS